MQGQPQILRLRSGKQVFDLGSRHPTLATRTTTLTPRTKACPRGPRETSRGGAPRLVERNASLRFLFHGAKGDAAEHDDDYAQCGPEEPGMLLSEWPVVRAGMIRGVGRFRSDCNSHRVCLRRR